NAIRQTSGRKVAAAHLGRGRYVDWLRQDSLYDAAPFIRAKEERLVLTNRSADRAAELVLAKFRLRRWKKCKWMRVQNVVAEKFIETAVNRVRAGLRNDVHDRTRVAAVLGIERVADDSEFLNGIGRRLDRGQIREEIVAVAAVHRIVVRSAA